MKLFLKILFSAFPVFLFCVFCLAQNNVAHAVDSQKTTPSEIITLDSKLCFNPAKKKPKLKSYKNYKKKNGKKIFFYDCCPIQVHKINNPIPAYPSAAKFVNAQGIVSVRVFVNEKGKVFWAEVESGHPLLRPLALKTACRTIFRPYICNCGKNEVRQFQTILYYNFDLK